MTITIRRARFIWGLNHIFYLGIYLEIWSCWHIIWSGFSWLKMLKIWNWTWFLLYICHLSLFNLFLNHLLNADLCVFDRLAIQILTTKNWFSLLPRHWISTSGANFFSVGRSCITVRPISTSWWRFELMITHPQILILLQFFWNIKANWRWKIHI